MTKQDFVIKANDVLDCKVCGRKLYISRDVLPKVEMQD